MKQFTFLFFLVLSPSVGLAWESLSTGLDYRVLSVGDQKAPVHLLRIDPKKYRFELLQARDHGKPRQFLVDMIGKQPVLAAINASFFDSENKPMGLLIRDGQELNSLRRAAWGIFQVVKGRPSIIHTTTYKPSKQRSLAIQSGPRLLIRGALPRFKAAIPKRRSGVCTTSRREVIIAVASPTPITLEEFAKSLQPYCRNALNFDGGSSTQFYLNVGDKKLLMEGFEPVPNALAITDSSIR